MGDAYTEMNKASDAEKAYTTFAREALDYLGDPSEIPEQIPKSLEMAAQELDNHLGKFESSASRNLRDILLRLQQGDWDTWRKLSLGVVGHTVPLLERAMGRYCDFDSSKFCGPSPVKDLMGYPRDE